MLPSKSILTSSCESRSPIRELKRLTIYQDWILDEARFQFAAGQHVVSPSMMNQLITSQQQLNMAWSRGRMSRAGIHDLSEIRIQQAFNYLVFKDMLGHSDLVSSGSDYSMLPELSFSSMPWLTRMGRQASHRADLSLGIFSENRSVVRAVVEIKSPGADLDAAQSGASYVSVKTGGQLSPIDQALETMEQAQCEWALVSNMLVVLLIHSSDWTRALKFDLLNLDGTGLRNLHFVLGPGGLLPDTSGVSRLGKLKLSTGVLAP